MDDLKLSAHKEHSCPKCEDPVCGDPARSFLQRVVLKVWAFGRSNATLRPEVSRLCGARVKRGG